MGFSTASETTGGQTYWKSWQAKLYYRYKIDRKVLIHFKAPFLAKLLEKLKVFFNMFIFSWCFKLISQTLFCAARSNFSHVHSCFFFFFFFWHQDSNFHLSLEILPSHWRCYTLQQLLQLPARDAPPGNHISSIGAPVIRQTSQTHQPFTWNITANTIYSPPVRSLTVSLSDVCSQHKWMQLYLYLSFCAN